MANLNYLGSLAQERMRFRSTTEVVVNNLNELFNAISIYVPKRFAQNNIVDWDNSLLTAARPAVFKAVVDNYTTIMRGDLLYQWQPVFRQDTNSDVTLYIIVFDDSVPGAWDISSRDIRYKPLEDAFNALFAFSYIKILFDPTYDGQDVVIPASPGTPAKMTLLFENVTRSGVYAQQNIMFSNTGLTNAVFPAGEYTFNDGVKTWKVTRAGAETFAASSVQLIAEADAATQTDYTVGATVPASDFVNAGSTALPSGLTGKVTAVNNGASSGGNAEVVIVFSNGTSSAITIPAGVYTHTAANTETITIAAAVTVQPKRISTVRVVADTVGYDPQAVDGTDLTALFIPALPAGMVAVSDTVIQGQDAGTGAPVTITAGTYNYTDGSKIFPIIVPADSVIAAGDVSEEITVSASIVGEDTSLTEGILNPASITPALPAGIQVTCVETSQGTEPVSTGTVATSQYFDLSLALASLCKNNIQLSQHWSFVKISYANEKPSSSDKCWIRYKTMQEQLAAMLDISVDDRNKYYWAALMLMGATQGTTWVTVHSEPEFILSDVLAAWFARRNDSGQFIGNKLSLLRLSGTRIKPLGWPSWLDNSINENDYGGHTQLNDMNVGYLMTISDNTPQECELSSARCIGVVGAGFPVTMQMIAKYVDYSCSMQLANMVTDKGTLTAPVLTNEAAYKEIQAIVMNTLNSFATTRGRLYGITASFPPFSKAKQGRTKIVAAASWHAMYQDDLDEAEVSGGISAE